MSKFASNLFCQPMVELNTGPSKISVDTAAVAMGYFNTLPGNFKLAVTRCFSLLK